MKRKEQRALETAREILLFELRENSIVRGEVTLASGLTSDYYIDARRAVMRPSGFRAAGHLIAHEALELGVSSVGGPATAAVPLACAAIAGDQGEGLVAFFVRTSRKEHGLQRWIEGPVTPGMSCMVVEDTVTTGKSTVAAIERIREEGLEIAGVLALVDRLAEPEEGEPTASARIEAAADAPYASLVTAEEILPDRD